MVNAQEPLIEQATDTVQPEQRKLKIGLCGAGLGGLAAAIAIARVGCDVTVLEAAAELGEVNMSQIRLLRPTGTDLTRSVPVFR